MESDPQDTRKDPSVTRDDVERLGQGALIVAGLVGGAVGVLISSLLVQPWGGCITTNDALNPDCKNAFGDAPMSAGEATGITVVITFVCVVVGIGLLALAHTMNR